MISRIAPGTPTPAEGWQDEQLAASITREKGLGLGEVLYRQLQQEQLNRK